MVSLRHLLQRTKEITIRNKSLHHALAWSFIGCAGLTSASALVVVPALAGATAFFISDIGGTTISLFGNRDEHYENNITAKSSNIGVHIAIFSLVATLAISSFNGFSGRKYRDLEKSVLSKMRNETYSRALKADEFQHGFKDGKSVLCRISRAPTEHECGRAVCVHDKVFDTIGVYGINEGKSYEICLPR